jgi:RNA polymerase sigma-70 factor (ECF subfamily)
VPTPSEAPDADGRREDIALVARVLGGETALFEQIIRRHNRRLYRVARSIVRSDSEAEDVVQETYVRAFAHLAQFEARASLATWLCRIAVYESFARVRRWKREAGTDVADDDEESLMKPAPADDPEQRAGSRQLGQLVERAIDDLPESFRAVFVLRAVEEMSVAETAECLGLVEETVKTRFFRARARLRARLMNELGGALAGVYDFHYERCDRIVAAVMSQLTIARGTRRPV